MEEGFVRFMRSWFYWVVVVLALIATFFAVFLPTVTVVLIFAIIAVSVFFIHYYHKYELLKKERRPLRTAPPPTMRVEEVDAKVSQMPDLDEMAQKAAAGGPKVRGNVVEGSGMDLVERYFPLGELLFPISFIADRAEDRFQDGSLEVGEPICLWHTTPVHFTAGPPEGGRTTFLFHCPKCKKGGKMHRKSLDETKKSVAFISTSMLREGKMSMMDESLMDAIKRGRGELPG